MASADRILEEFGDSFLSCSICIQYFVEPKLLPCLHRYCKSCLDSYISRQGVGELQCAVCRKSFVVPPEGFKTDYTVKSIIEYIKEKKPKSNDRKCECIGCAKTRKPKGYCFDRNGYLCQACYAGYLSGKAKGEDFPTIATLREVILEIRQSTDIKKITFDRAIEQIKILAEREQLNLQEDLRCLVKTRTEIRKIPSTESLIKRNDALIEGSKMTASSKFGIVKQQIQYEITTLRRLRINALIRVGIEPHQMGALPCKGKSYWKTNRVGFREHSIISKEVSIKEKLRLLQMFKEIHDDCLQSLNGEKYRYQMCLLFCDSKRDDLIQRSILTERVASKRLELENAWSALRSIPEICETICVLNRKMNDLLSDLEFEMLLNNKADYIPEYKTEVSTNGRDSYVSYFSVRPPHVTR